jgi:hypothetical protein
MDEEKPPLTEEEIRRLVQREISEREKIRDLEKRIQDERGRAKEEIERHRQIIEEEKRRYYESHPEYHEYINENGELEWLTTEEIRQREMLFDDEIEELESGKKRAQVYLLLGFGLFLVAVVIIIALLTEKTGSIQVISNVKGARIILDSAPVEQVTDAIFTDIPVGKHVISVEKPGYKIAGDPSQQVNLTAHEKEIVIFMLEEDLAARQETADQIRTVFSSESGENPPRSATNP